MRISQDIRWYKFVPNLFTSGNMICGIIGLYFTLNGKIEWAVWLMILAALFDFLDGFLARILKATSEFGKQLDSLSDLISFGLLPGALAFVTIKASLGDLSALPGGMKTVYWFCLVSPVFIPLFSAFRLAKFNIDPRQKSEFIGLPTPANALFFASLSLTLSLDEMAGFRFLNHPIILTALVVLFSILLVINLPLFSLKFYTYRFRENWIRYFFLIGSALIVFFLSISGLALVVIFYILLSVFRNVLCKKTPKSI